MSDYLMSKMKLEEVTLRYWQASMAWKNREDWAKGWTQGSFGAELRFLCHSNHRVGFKADDLLDDFIYNHEEKPLGSPGNVVSIHSRPKSLVKQN